ncbi:MAG TPA: hypothetical protein ENJ00_11340 [Phycisphaerales bacterium]|nr:hypothetical protein [Phycisphaerales bacterium]
MVGAHIRAELNDRFSAHRLAEAVDAELLAQGLPLRSVVCTDLWYLNDDRLRPRPTISVGEPSLNALTAFLADKLPDVYSVRDELIVQMDLKGEDHVVCCWGRDAEMTRRAIAVFCERYLEQFVRLISGSV